MAGALGVSVVHISAGVALSALPPISFRWGRKPSASCPQRERDPEVLGVGGG
jgi:hypothetical protein